MKSNLILLVIICASLTASAQILKADRVPAVVKSAFAKKHPNTTAKWEKEDGNYEASFKENGKTASCVIDANGNVLENEKEIAVSQLPASIIAYVKTNYKNAKIQEAAEIANNKGIITYEARVKGKDLIFDANGKYLKTTKD